jgi:hypothetical protein
MLPHITAVPYTTGRRHRTAHLITVNISSDMHNQQQTLASYAWRIFNLMGD